MFWADIAKENIEREFKDRIAKGEKLIIRDEKTASGRVHVGSMRGVAMHGAVSEVLTEAEIANEFFYEINDTDPMDGLPVYLDKEVYQKFMGQPLYTIPSPDGKAKNYAEYFAEEFLTVVQNSGYHPTVTRSSEKYKAGEFNEVIKTALEKAADIRRIYKDVSGSVKPEDWYPLNVICENCGKIGTTKVTGFDGEMVTYSCMPKMVEWAEGCGHSGKISPFNGNGTLPWKVEWAAKFVVYDVNIEGAGKDHATKGGSREVAVRICKEVFNHAAPFDIPYEFFLFGGKKMSSSKGQGASAKEVSDLLPPHIFRLALIGKDIKQQVNFDPSGDTIPTLFDTYDRLAEKMWSGIEDDDTRVFRFIHFPEEYPTLHIPRFLPRFSQVAFIVQMPHLDLLTEVEKLKGSALSNEDKAEAELRAKYSRFWLEKYADDQFKFTLQSETPESAKSFSPEQKAALQKLLQFVESNEVLEGEALHSALHEIRKESGLDAKQFFSAIYQSFLGKDSGPKAGWFLSVIDRELLISRLKEVSQ